MWGSHMYDKEIMTIYRLRVGRMHDAGCTPREFIDSCRWSKIEGKSFVCFSNVMVTSNLRLCCKCFCYGTSTKHLQDFHYYIMNCLYAIIMMQMLLLQYIHKASLTTT